MTRGIVPRLRRVRACQRADPMVCFAHSHSQDTAMLRNWWQRLNRRNGKSLVRGWLRLEQLEERMTPSITSTNPLISPVAGHRDLVYDSAHQRLYITTSTGTVERFDVATQQL